MLRPIKKHLAFSEFVKYRQTNFVWVLSQQPIEPNPQNSLSPSAFYPIDSPIFAF